MDLKHLKNLGEGDHLAFDALFIQYHQKVKRFLYGFIKDDDVACDLAQDLFLKVWTNRVEISKVDSFKAYLFRMARNMIYDYFEHILTKERYADSKQSDLSYFEVLEEEIYAKELSLLMDIAVERMPEQRRRIFVMSRREGLSNEEIANQLNISKRTVENHITLALSELRKIAKTMMIFFF